MLRSVAVQVDYRHQHVGQQLLTAVQQRGIQRLFLITTTADHYFGRLGFERIERNLVPDTISATRQFSGLCPASAVVM
ncbi:GNAT family N-acetyltransferase [Spirosoma soli]|uniref:GNAT family N-acetyltransferase n=1 Tax=Spirosoma soli TaxID=1770529 RepID=A0ABW5M0S6_9BACT